MSPVRTSLRAEQRVLREGLRGQGLSDQEVAAEFGRRYGLRPRAAWRNAFGWSLTEAAERINAYAASAGLGSGSTVAMTAAHLCEHESWPGLGSAPTGRRPTPYLLSLLAAVYGCEVPELLDAADYAQMPSGDRLVLDTICPGGSPMEQERSQGADAGGLASGAGLAWGSTPVEVTRIVAGLLGADMRRRDMIASVWAAAALSEPVGRWLLDPVDRDASSGGSRLVGSADVAAVWAMCSSFADADHRLGGGHARQALISCADEVVAPLLAGRYTDRIGRELFAATARLFDVAGFMCFDCDLQGLGQRYFVAALRLAKVSGDLALGAHILADMAMQALDRRHAEAAVTLADAGVATARRSGSGSVLARCQAVRARALALAGDAADSDHALGRAEDALDRAGGDDEPSWVTFFTARQLAAESMYAAAELHRPGDVQRHAVLVLDTDDGMQRRRVLATATLAASYLPDGDGDAAADVEQACEVLRGILPVIGTQTSARALNLVGDVRRRLAAYPELPAVQELEHQFAQCTAVGAS
jgi:hypothetical protein